MFHLAFVSVALSIIPQALAHGGVIAYSNAGKWYDGWHPYNTPVGQTSVQRPWATYDPILDPASSTIACNNDGMSSAAQLTATVAAGSAVVAYWNDWPHPYGPMLTYLAQCPGSTCTGVSASSLKWFKIDQSGLISGTVGSGYWGSGKMIDNNNTWTTTIPSSVPSGNYLIRFETIALHSLPAQFYPECAQITITGGGNKAPSASELVSLPGAYKSTDPGINLNLYSNEAQTSTQYIIPGPPLYGTGGTVTQPPSNPGTSVPAPTSAPPATSQAPPPASGTVPQFGQCGGIGYSGATGCIAPFTCKKQNDYYSQCL